MGIIGKHEFLLQCGPCDHEEITAVFEKTDFDLIWTSPQPLSLFCDASWDLAEFGPVLKSAQCVACGKAAYIQEA